MANLIHSEKFLADYFNCLFLGIFFIYSFYKMSNVEEPERSPRCPLADPRDETGAG